MSITRATTPPNGPAKARALLAFAALALALALLATGAIPCPFAALTHQPCPGCGVTRASRALLRGDLAGALHHHPLVWLILPLVAFELTRQTFAYIVDRPARTSVSKAATAGWIVALALLLAVWIARFLGALGGPEPV